MRTLLIPHKIRKKIQIRTQTSGGYEVCALLIGSNETGDAVHLSHLIFSPNIAQTPQTHFLIDPRLQFRIVRRIRGTRLKIIGTYHSHPTDTVYPSQTDLDQGEGLIWLISDSKGQILRAFYPDVSPEAPPCEYSITFV